MNPCDFSRILASAPDLHNSRYPRKSGCHTTFHHRYHLAWAPKCRFKVLQARSACGYFPATSGTIRSEERRVGKSVSVRVDLGGRRLIKKKKHTSKRDIDTQKTQ